MKVKHRNPANYRAMSADEFTKAVMANLARLYEHDLSLRVRQGILRAKLNKKIWQTGE